MNRESSSTFDIFEDADIDKKKNEKKKRERNKKTKQKKRKISYTILLFFTSRMYIRTKRKSDDDISSFLQATRWNDFFT